MSLWIDSTTGKLVNINAPYKGRSKLDTPDIRAEVGVIEIQAEQPPEPPVGFSVDEAFYRSEDWNTTTGPYIVWTLKSQAQLDAIAAERAKQAAKAAATGDVEADIVCRYLREHTPLETYQYVQANVTDLASAKAIIGKLAAAVGVLLR